MPKKSNSHSSIKSYYNEFGYTLISEYKNSRTKDTIICPEGHEFKILFNNFKQGRRCRECYLENRKSPQEYVENYYKEHGYTLDSIYNDNKNYDQLICPNDHKVELRFDSFISGVRCSECYGNKKLTHDFVFNYYKEHGYTLNTIYKNSKNKDELLCPESHKIYIRFNSFKQGCRCSVCYHENNHGSNASNWKGDTTRSSRAKRLSFDLRKINMLNDDPNHNNYLLKKEDYNIDHIFPRVAFIDNNLDNIYSNKIIKEICNSRNNLQIIPKIENSSKAGKYNKDEFINWFENKIKEYMNGSNW